MGLTRITSDGITDGTISTADLADQSVTLAKLPHGTSSNNGKFLRANNGADPTFETINSFGTGSLVGDQSPQLGGDLDTNSNDIKFADNDKALFGANSDLRIYHDGSNSYITDLGTGDLNINGDDINILTNNNGEYAARFIENGTVILYNDGSEKFRTTSTGTKVTGADLTVIGTEGISAGLYLIADEGDDNGDGWRLNSNQDDNDLTIANNISGSYVDKLTLQNDGDLFTTGDVYLKNDSKKLKFGASDDLSIFHNGSNTQIVNITGHLLIGSERIKLTNPSHGHIYVDCILGGAVELYHNNTKKFETLTYGAKITNSGSYAGLVVGSTTGDGAYVYLDGDANGDASGSDYGYIGMTHQGVIRIHNHKNEDIEFANNNTVRARFTSSGNFVPQANNTYDLGSTGARWQNIFTNDLNLSNEGSSNDVDGTWGSYTIQEGAEDLFLVNKRNGKKYKFNLTEVS